VEKIITGAELNNAVIEKACESAMKGAEPLEKNAYKIPMFKGLIREQLEALRSV
jgi:CO/xanthine dehydrogenase FAD-binding subunit